MAHVPLFAAGAVDVALPLGDCYFYGLGGTPVDVGRAAQLYAVAADAGNPQAAYNLGYLVSTALVAAVCCARVCDVVPPCAPVQYEYGAGPLPRNELKAEMYYRRVLELAPAGGGHIVPVQLALFRIQARAWARHHGLWPLVDSSRADISSVALERSYEAAATSLSSSWLSRWIQWCLDTHHAADEAPEGGSGSGGSGSGAGGVAVGLWSAATAEDVWLAVAFVSLCVLVPLVYVRRRARR
jgi:hypothetical protein